MASKPERTDRMAFDNRDRGVLRGLIILGVVLSFGYALVRPSWDWARGNPLRVPYSGEVSVPGLEGTDVTVGEASFNLIVPDPSATQRMLDALPDLLAGGVALLVLVLLYRVLGDIARGEPFAQNNVTRLRLIAFSIALGWSAAGVTAASVTMPILVATDIGDLPLASTWMMPVLPLGIGMVVALLAEAFQMGAELRDDVDGLV